MNTDIYIMIGGVIGLGLSALLIPALLKFLYFLDERKRKDASKELIKYAFYPYRVFTGFTNTKPNENI